MIKILITILIFVFSYNSFAQNDAIDLKKICLGKSCTKPIKEFKISNFFFKTRNCETKDYRKCLLWFGNKENKVKISWVKYYRIINGPIPTKSTCIKGKPVWFQDIPFPNNKDRNINILKFFRKFNYQNKEKMYFNDPIIKTFNYFSQSDKSLGVLVQSKNFKGIRKKQIYVFDTEGDNFEVVKPLCKND